MTEVENNNSNNDQSQRYYSKHNLNKDKSTPSFISNKFDNQSIDLNLRMQDIAIKEPEILKSDELIMNSARSYSS